MFIQFEGPECTGKTTVAKMLEERLADKGYDVYSTKEPGSPLEDTCKDLRQLLLHKDRPITDEAALFMFLADRAQHMHKVVLPLLKEGKIVICDRGSLSTLFYYVASLKEEWNFPKTNPLYDMLSLAAAHTRPDICFISNADTVWMELQLEAKDKDRIESKGDEFHSRVAKYFANEEGINSLQGKSFAPKQCVYMPRVPDYTPKQVTEFVYNKVKEMV